MDMCSLVILRWPMNTCHNQDRFVSILPVYLHCLPDMPRVSWWISCVIGLMAQATEQIIPCNVLTSPVRTEHFITLRWRHNDHAGVSNHQPHGCLLNRLFRRKSKKTSKLRVTGLCAGNSPGTGEFPAQMASYAENVSIWWRHHEMWTRLLRFAVDVLLGLNSLRSNDAYIGR